ncbi:hypothetical protein J3458_000751 [Metarhizium acridum]|uniref:uncharacterized protein n=1 Tax=Metarhizium acridum TaxID=92637 RepID=UPI001C6B0F2A|nr:hypothetical protein J3458_000751 [Metarhizium acridum]
MSKSCVPKARAAHRNTNPTLIRPDSSPLGREPSLVTSRPHHKRPHHDRPPCLTWLSRSAFIICAVHPFQRCCPPYIAWPFTLQLVHRQAPLLVPTTTALDFDTKGKHAQLRLRYTPQVLKYTLASGY